MRVSTVEALANLSEVKNSLIIPGISDDRVDDAIMNMVGFGDRVIGLVDGNVVVEWKSLPDDYIVSHAPDTSEKIFGMRERPEAALKGLFTEDFNVDGNHTGTRFIRQFGIAARNRVGALAMEIGSATYTDPTGYDPRQEK